jgi:hypothetical protein
MSAKIELQTQRHKLIEQLKTESDPRRIALVQADLTIVNAEIKKLNIIESAEATRNATVRKALGAAQHEADIARASERIAVGAPQGFQTPKQQLTYSELLMRNAKQMLEAIEANQAHKLPHIAAFEGPLRVFIEAHGSNHRQDLGLRARIRLRLGEQHSEPTESESEWQDTWKAD